MSGGLGDYDLSAVVYGKFTTYRPSTGAPHTLAGTPALSVYKDASTTQSTAGITLIADFDSVTGLSHFAIDTSADGAFYSSGSFFDIVITAGTVDSVSAVGTVVGRFTLRKNSSVKPTTAGRTLNVNADGEASVDGISGGPYGINIGTVRPCSTLNIPFATYAAAGGSVTMSGFAVADIRVYKNGGTTERGSTSGYALLDTDGIDFDSVTGLHGFSIDLADNTTAGFYASGASYWVVVSAITVDSQTVTFIAATFDIGYPGASLNTTIAGVTDNYTFTLSAGPAEDDALNGMELVVHDVASATQISHGLITDYVGSTKQVSLRVGELTFNVAAGDNIAVFAGSKHASLVKTQTDQLVFTPHVKASVEAVIGTEEFATQLSRFLRGVVYGSATTGGSTTSVAYSSITPTPTAANQFVGRRIEFVADCSTTALRGAGAYVTANAIGGSPTITVSPALPAAPTTGDRFAILSGPANSDAGLRAAVGLAAANLDAQIATLATVGAAMTLTSAYDFAKGTVAMTEAYATDGSAPTPAQILFMIWAVLAEKTISGVTLTAKKLDGSTTAMTFTLDSSSAPTSITRSG